MNFFNIKIFKIIAITCLATSLIFPIILTIMGMDLTGLGKKIGEDMLFQNNSSFYFFVIYCLNMCLLSAFCIVFIILPYAVFNDMKLFKAESTEDYDKYKGIMQGLLFFSLAGFILNIITSVLQFRLFIVPYSLISGFVHLYVSFDIAENSILYRKMIQQERE